MKNLLYLLKNNVLQLSKINQLRYADYPKRNRTIGIYVLVIAVLTTLLIYWGKSFVPIFSMTWELETIITAILLPMALICLVLNLFFSLFWGSGLLYHDKNVDFMLALPIPLAVLIIAKLSIVYLVQAALDMVLLFPMMVLFGQAAGMDIAYYLFMAVAVLFLPIVPSFLGTIIGTGIYRIIKSSSSRIARFKTIGALLILFAFFIFMFWKFPDIANGDFTFHVSLTAPSEYLSRLRYGEFMAAVCYFGSVLLIGGVLLGCLCLLYRRCYCSSAQNYTSQRNRLYFKKVGLIATLLSRERTRYFSLPVYLTNTACGLLLAAVLVILMVLIPEKMVSYIQLLAEYFEIQPAEYSVLYIFLFTILISLSSTTYASVSIEGSQMEMLKALPVTATEIFKAKIFFHLSVTSPVIFILNTLMAIAFHWSWSAILLGYLMPFLYSFFIGVTGYILNLIFPNFEWENATQIIKQSVPAILSALLGVVATGGSMYVLLKCFPDSLLMGSFILCGIFLIATSVLVLWINRFGIRIFEKIQIH